MAASVVYTREGDIQTFETGTAGLPSITVDHTGIPAEERGGLAKHLLASAALACYGGMLAAVLEARKSRFTAITGNAVMEMGPNEKGQGRVTSMRLEFSVDLPGSERDMFERCEKIMRNGCLLTGSLEEGIAMSYALDANFQEE